MKVKLIFAWYDFWIGLFYDQKKKRLYVFPIPMIGIIIQFRLFRVIGKCQGNNGLCEKPATHEYSDLLVCKGHYDMYHDEFDEEYR